MLNTQRSERLDKDPNTYAWIDRIEQLPLSNPQLANSALKKLLDHLLKTRPNVKDFINLLEQLRPVTCFVQEQLARHYINKPLPLDQDEERFFLEIVVIWIKMTQCYAFCTQVLLSHQGSADDLAQLALALHRCIYYIEKTALEHHRVRREIPSELWRDLYNYFSQAESQDIANVAVPDVLNHREPNSTCSSVFLGLLLTTLASPYGLANHDQILAHALASKWSTLVSLHHAAPDECLSPFIIDLKQKIGHSLIDNISMPGEKWRQLWCIDTSRLTIHLKHLLKQISQNGALGNISSAAGCTPSQYKRLLARLLVLWSQARSLRKYARRISFGEVLLSVGLESAHFHILGNRAARFAKYLDKPLSEDSQPTTIIPQPDIEPSVTNEHHAQKSQSLDRWRIINQSANGFCLGSSQKTEKIVR